MLYCVCWFIVYCCVLVFDLCRVGVLCVLRLLCGVVFVLYYVVLYWLALSCVVLICLCVIVWLWYVCSLMFCLCGYLLSSLDLLLSYPISLML